jgi:hypothetical protein
MMNASRQQWFCKIRATEHCLKYICNSNRLLYLGRSNKKVTAKQAAVILMPVLRKAPNVGCYCMTQTQTSLLDWLKQTSVIKSRPDFIATLVSIDELSNNDIDKAFLLGHFFKYRLNLDNLPLADKKQLIDTLKNKRLDEYFYLKKKPKTDFPRFVNYFVAAAGLTAIIAGTTQLINDNSWVGVGTKYVVTIVREGGYKVILGLIFFIGGLLRIQQDSKRNTLLKSLTK